ncbi:MAG: ORF6N domain-containing protein [Paramuribaculum sp.]|nr:ORF6N domain-containing protein [Paramuribaculum sp.]MDE6459932.1 ORF6N domain-containing protein [Paramuribaculum sp.]
MKVKSSIALVRDSPVIADADVACLYGVETKHINQAVRNNPEKFPMDYMFVLTEEATDKISTPPNILPEYRK